MAKRIICTGLVFVLSLFNVTASFPQLLFGGEETGGDLVLVVGEVTVVPVSFPQRVSIRNPEIADISKVADKEIVLVAKKSGETALNVWDKEGTKVYNITVYEQDLDRIKQKLDKLIRKELKVKNVILKKNESMGKVIITGDVKALDKEQIDKVVEPFKDRVDNLLTVKKESKMVEVEARVLELSKSELDKLGVEWQQYLQIRQEPYVTENSNTAGVQTTLDISKRWTAAWGMGKWSRDALTAKINTLIQTGKGKELSRPKLLCLSGEEAKLTVGGEVPYVSGSTTGAAGTSVSIAYKEYGVILKMRPMVSLDGKKIYTSLRSEVSALDWVNAVIVSGIKIPAFTTRVAETVLNLNSGDTIFIAGLIKSKDSENIQKFPALGEVPVLGMLFRSKDFQNDQTELVISLSPKVVTQEDQEDFGEAKDTLDQKTFDLYTGIIPDDLRGYVATVQNQIADNIAYPPSLLNTGWGGMVVLKLNLDHTGDLKNVQVSKSSGHRIFDAEAVKLVRSLSFPPFPPDVGVTEVNLEIPIVYKEKHGH
jgi:pilus assembly protein CpaC